MNPLKIPGLNTSWVIPAEEIMRVEAASSYSRIYFANGEKLVVPKVLHWFQDLLPAEMFVRVHRSHLINKLFVQRIKGNHTKSLVLNNGESITISKRKKSCQLCIN